VHHEGDAHSTECSHVGAGGVHERCHSPLARAAGSRFSSLAVRILIINTLARRVGGAESYLAGLIPALRARGHEIGLAYLHEGPPDRDLLPVADGPCLDFGARPGAAAREALAWAPDVVFAHGLEHGVIIAMLQGIAPLAQFAHNYAGACISGTKTHQSVPKPCSRPLGWGCLAHYYPHRCGGLSPRTLWRDFGRERRFRDHLRRAGAVITASAHMAGEMARQGVDPARIHTPTFFVPAVERAAAGDLHLPREAAAEVRLLFAGRMDAIKGGDLLIEALPQVVRALGRPVSLTLLGDGPMRARWEDAALRVTATEPRARSHFPGWEQGLEAHLARTDLLVVPSIWPEPFGMVGPEAGVHGVPAAAFAVGGIPDWLTDGENGHLAPGDRPAAAPLADAIVRALADPSHHAALAEGARRLAQRFRLAGHVDAVERILRSVVGDGAGRATDPPLAR
jgi:glycosyltransferase involved in cell wall biosynthesis